MPIKPLRILLILVILSSCKEDKEKPAAPLSFENKTIIQKSKEDCDDERNPCSFISLEMLKAQGPEEVSKRINSTLEEHVINIVSTEENPTAGSIAEVAENFLKQQQHTAEEFQENIPWRALVNQSVYSHTEDLVSIGIDAQVSTGGAHGYRSLTFLNFDAKSGEPLSKEALFAEGFTDYAEKKFREEEGIPQNENINSTGFWFENDNFQLPQNIGFEADSIILVYNPYEISSYADGEFFLKFAKDDVQQFLKLDRK